MKSWLLGKWEVVTRIVPAPISDVSFVNQVHGNAIAVINEYQSTRPPADAIYTTGNVTVGIITADCLPLVLVSDTAALAAHVSRASLTAGLLDNVSNYLNVQEINGVYFGPHICAKHLTYSYLGPQLKAFAKKFPNVLKHDTEYSISLRTVVDQYLSAWGVATVQREEDGRCTFENKDLVSYRRRLANKDTSPRPYLITTVRRQNHG